MGLVINLRIICFGCFGLLATIALGQGFERNYLQISGDSISVAAASKLLENAGGKDVWRKNYFIVYERAFLKSGQIADLKITRDLEDVTRKIESRSGKNIFEEYIGKDKGCISLNGKVEMLDSKTLEMEKEGLMQSPYYIYHRLAREDGRLHVELVDNGNRLNIYQDNDRLLCWFLLDDMGQQYSWGNFYNDKINQHFYGPYKMIGEARLPSWGSSMDGGFRFEYLMSEFSIEDIKIDCDL